MTIPCPKHEDHTTRLGNLCAKLKAIEERIHPYEEMYADMYFGENSFSSRLRAQEEIMKGVREEIKGMVSGLKWFIGILVGIIIAVYGASFGILWSEIQDSLKAPHSYSLPNMPSQQAESHSPLQNAVGVRHEEEIQENQELVGYGQEACHARWPARTDSESEKAKIDERHGGDFQAHRVAAKSPPEM